MPVKQFWPRVRIEPSGCWVWTGSCLKNGYGQFNVGGHHLVVHRWAYERFVGPIPEGLTLDHLCRNRACVNLDHLEPVTRGENVLRGTGFAARNARKTHCPQGHEYTPANTIVCRDGYRKCRICANAAVRAWHERQKSFRTSEKAPPKTHCLRGHEYTPENTRVDKHGKRYCRTCHRERNRREYQERRSLRVEVSFDTAAAQA